VYGTIDSYYVVGVAVMNANGQKCDHAEITDSHHFKIKYSVRNILLDYYLFIVWSKDL
jgi:hypothetical protein